MHTVGPGTREWIVSPATCPPLHEHGIRLVGRSAAAPGFRFVRSRADMGQVLACIAGEGAVLIGDQWQRCAAGMAYLTPPGAGHAYHALAGEPWRVCWAMFQVGGASPLRRVSQPRLVQFDAHPLNVLIQELYRESVGPADLTMMRQWVGLIHRHADRACGPEDHRARLLPIWEAVDADLARPWTLTDLARLASMSREHLRRLCRRQHGRSPMRCVADLRLRRAASLLLTAPWTVEAIAHAVGYDNAFAFSTAFKRRFGASPSRYRHAEQSTRT